MGAKNINTENSQRRIAFILNRLSTGKAATPELAQVAGCCADTTMFYIKHLVEGRSVKCVQEGKRQGADKRPAMWALTRNAIVPPMPSAIVVAPTKIKKVTEGPFVSVLTSWPAITIPKQSIFAALGL